MSQGGPSDVITLQTLEKSVASAVPTGKEVGHGSKMSRGVPLPSFCPRKKEMVRSRRSVTGCYQFYQKQRQGWFLFNPFLCCISPYVNPAVLSLLLVLQ